MKLHILFVFVLLLIIACKSNIYPPEIVKNKLEAKYDTAKWVVYASNYRSNYLFCHQNHTKMVADKRFDLIINNDTGYVKNINIIDCEIILDELKVYKDTIIMQFYCFVKDTFESCYPRDNFFINQIIFINKSPIIYRIDSESKYDSTTFKLQREIERDSIKLTNIEYYGFYPLRIEEKTFPLFLRNYKGKINPWLRNEAIKRGVLKE